MKKLFLIDAFALIYRAYFALNKNPRINSKGLNTSAVLGFANTILDIINKYKPDMMAVAFESKKTTFRKEEFKEYKSNRQAMPEELSDSIPYIERFLQASNIAIVSCEGYEADDVVGTLAKKGKAAGLDVYMVTPDKDYCQLIEENISIIHLAMGLQKEKIITTEDVLEKFEIKDTKQVIDLLGLWGDSSDNIPGVKGIGEKKAKALMQQFRSIEEILENTDKIENKSIRKAIEENKEQAILSKHLATIRLDVPLEFNHEDYLIKQPDIKQCQKLFKELEFNKFSQRYYKIFNIKESSFAENNDLLVPENATQKQKIENTQSPDLFSYIDTNNVKSTNTLSPKSIIIDKKSEYYPIILASYLINPEQRIDNNYIILHAEELKKQYLNKLKQDCMEKLYYDVELPLKDVLLDMEQEGFRLDTDALKEFSNSLQKQKDNLQQQIYSLAGEEFNISSPKQLGEILFVKMDILKGGKARKTKSKQFSTAEDVLVKLKNKTPIIDLVLRYREIAKLKNTYVDALPLLVNPKTHKIHTSFNQTVTATGRLSSTNPNLQNIPIRTELGKEIRKAFVASDDDHLLLSADYSQIELRIIASMSGDEHLCNEFSLNHDIHTATAAKIYKVPQKEVTKDMRSAAKSVNFGIIYGVSAFGLSENLNIKRTEAQALIDQYFESFPKIKEFINSKINFARQHGYAQTLLGRRRYLNNIKSANSNLRSFDERNAVNMTIQGTGADMIKVAMVNIFKRLSKENLHSKMILQIHDELIFDIYKSELETMKNLVKQEMETALPLTNVPVLASLGWGNNLLEIH